MNRLLLHPTTEHQYIALRQAQPHAILIAGATGSGKETLAANLLQEILDEQAYRLEIRPEQGSIGIDAVRGINDFLARKTTGKKTLRRVVAVHEAQQMTTEAQNALLKVLEEPPEDTMFVLTVSDPLKLKSTIRSRTQLLRVLPVSLDAAMSYFQKNSNAETEIQKAYYISQGRTGLLSALLDSSAQHELVGAIAAAKELLQQDQYERLLSVDRLSKDREQAVLLLEGMERVITSGLRMAAHKNNEKDVRKFYYLAQRVGQAQAAAESNANLKLALTDLFLNM